MQTTPNTPDDDSFLSDYEAALKLVEETQGYPVRRRIEQEIRWRFKRAADYFEFRQSIERSDKIIDHKARFNRDVCEIMELLDDNGCLGCMTRKGFNYIGNPGKIMDELHELGMGWVSKGHIKEAQRRKKDL